MKDLKTKILKGDFSDLLESGNDKRLVHPNDVAQLIATLPDEYAVQSFISLSKVTQTVVFAYLSFDKQLHIIKGISKDRGSDILNHLPSDDRFSFFQTFLALNSLILLNIFPRKIEKKHIFF
jgi:Mg/Co/Ni transporter MgtE